MKPTYPALSLNDTKLLLGQLFRRDGIATTATVVDEIAPIIGGYPPAAYYTASYSKLYGVDSVILDKSILADFKSRNFSRFLADLRLSDSEWIVLQYLSSEVAVPLAAVAVALGSGPDTTVRVVRSLIDRSLVLVFGENYALSPPIREAVERARGRLSAKDYNHIADGLTKLFWARDDVAPSLQVIDATLHAVARSDKTSSKRR